MIDEIRTKVRCERCDGNGDGCRRCIGFGWLWGDGRAPTVCPGAMTRKPGLPCGRASGKCSGCNRPVESIGLDEDVAATWKFLSENSR